MSALEDEALWFPWCTARNKEGINTKKITTCDDEKLFPHTAIAMI
jgi:hypothetical protein